MASATVDPPSDRLQLESIATVDLRLLSQSELYALSLCSNGAFDPHRWDDVVIPKIDRSVFNESAGSRKQTYSRLRLAPRKPESSAAVTTIATIPRRAPHLRTPKSAPNTIGDADPEGAENSQIIGILKELFTAETNGDDLVPIRVEYIDSVPHLPNVGDNVKKRKRGRPRKNENLTVVAAEAAEVVPVEVQAEGGDDVIKDIVVYENAEDRDKDIVDKNGNVVDLATLASLEDPYGPELQRRTEDLKTEEEMLGFLRGLNGQWGSRRKKKKIVDASEFGDALPKGWKILLSLKKKEGRVWLFIRRYISPSGRQFVSCKEGSSYLFSLLGLHDVNQPNFVQSNENMQLTYKIACGDSADPAVKEINKRGDFLCYSPSVMTHVLNDHEKQVTSEVRNSVDIQMGKNLKCDKCTMTFDARDDLLHHQLSCHRRKRSRFGTSVTDGVIIKGGQYECQFCHKTFYERNRYNGHVGAHIRHHMKSDEASPGVLSMQNIVCPVSSDGVSPEESMLKTSVGHDYDALTFNAKADNELKPVSPQSKFRVGSDIESYTDRSGNEVNILSHDEHDPKSNRTERNFAEELCVKHNKNYNMNTCLRRVDEATDFLDSVALSHNETNHNSEANIPECSAHKINDWRQIDVNADSGRVEEPNQEAVPAPNASEKTGGIETMEDERFKLEDNGSAASAGIRDEFGQEKGSEGNLLILSGCEETCCVKNDVGNISTMKMEPKIDRVQTYGNNELGFGISYSKLSAHRSLEFCSLVMSGNEQIFNVEENVTGVCNSTEEPPKQESSFDGGLLTLQSYTGKSFGDVCTMNRLSTSSIKEPKPDEVQKYSNSELILAFGNNDAGIAADIDDSVPIEQTFSFETNLRENSSTGKDYKQESGLPGPSCYTKTCGDESNLNRVHDSRVWVGPMIDEVGNYGHDKLTIAFGGSNAQSDGEIMPGSMWRTGGENVLQSTLANPSTQQEQSSSCFPTFSVVSNKDEHELLRVNGKYGSMSGVEMTQSRHTEPVEFSFLTMQNLNPHPGNSKALSYEPEIGQGFDSSFWLEKDALSLNLAAGNQVTTLCVWCRNEFHHEPVLSGTQTGAIGSMCPTCSAKVSEQFNVF